MHILLMFQIKMHVGNLDGSNMGTLSVVTKNNKGQQRVLLKMLVLLIIKKVKLY